MVAIFSCVYFYYITHGRFKWEGLRFKLELLHVICYGSLTCRSNNGQRFDKFTLKVLCQESKNVMLEVLQG